MGVLLLRLELQRVCQVCGEGVSLRKIRGRGPFNGSPASQTLIVLSLEPDTIVLPSGAKSTERIQSLCAFSLLVLSSRETAKHTGRASERGKSAVGVSSTAYLRPKL